MPTEEEFRKAAETLNAMEVPKRSEAEIQMLAGRAMDRGERILEAIEEDVVMRLNPSGKECWHCGGEGYTHDCFDGFCETAEDGCADCMRPCPECTIFNGQIAKAVREEVIKSGDAEVAVAWLKSIGRWHEGITMDRVQAELAAAAKSKG